MGIWSILLIKSDLKWCIHLSRSLLLYIHTWKEGMAHNQFVLQQLNFHHFIRVRFRLRRYFRRCRMWRRKWLHPARRRAFGIYDQLLLELRHEDPSTFQEISLHGSCLRWNPCKGQRKNLETVHLVQGAPGRRSRAGSYSSSSCSWLHIPWNAVWVEGAWKRSVFCGQGGVSGHMWRVCRWSDDIPLKPRWTVTTWWILQALKFPPLCCCY